MLAAQSLRPLADGKIIAVVGFRSLTFVYPPPNPQPFGLKTSVAVESRR